MFVCICWQVFITLPAVIILLSISSGACTLLYGCKIKPGKGGHSGWCLLRADFSAVPLESFYETYQNEDNYAKLVSDTNISICFVSVSVYCPALEKYSYNV